jgi:hypothetical protein
MTTSRGAIASLPVRTTRADLPTSHVNASRQPASSAAPASVQLDAGTRLWISVKSLAPLPTGDFEFRGTLLLPVEHSGTVLLERNTGIHGIGKRNNGRVSLRVVDLTIRGARYELKNETDAMNAEVSGTGGAVEFSAGHVFEMFMSSQVVYAK